ncbi:MAG: hypothetical protein WKG07_08900 [Hymenobacter sp.]
MRWYQSMKCPLVQPDGTAHVLCVSTDITTLKGRPAGSRSGGHGPRKLPGQHEPRDSHAAARGAGHGLACWPNPARRRPAAASWSTIQHTGQHLLSVVNDVLDMAKITSGQLELEQTAFNLCECMSNAVQPLVVLAQRRRHHRAGCAPERIVPPPWVVGDPYRLNQILLNLVSNAIKFTPPGGTISVGGFFVSETDTNRRRLGGARSRGGRTARRGESSRLEPRRALDLWRPSALALGIDRRRLIGGALHPRLGDSEDRPDHHRSPMAGSGSRPSPQQLKPSRPPRTSPAFACSIRRAGVKRLSLRGLQGAAQAREGLGDPCRRPTPPGRTRVVR